MIRQDWQAPICTLQRALVSRVVASLTKQSISASQQYCAMFQWNSLFQQLLDVSEEYLNHPSCLVELRDCGSRQLEVVSEQLYHIAMFVIPDSYTSERFGVFFFVCSPVGSIISSMSTFCALVSGNKRSSICECRLSLCLTTKNTFLLSQLSRREKSQ